jgi:hypothetical protein
VLRSEHLGVGRQVVECLQKKQKVLQSFEISLTIYQMTHSNISEDIIFWNTNGTT